MQGACAITPLEIATFEEHEAVVQLLLAADQDSNSEIEIIEDNESGGSAEVEISTPPLHSDLDDISEAPRQHFEPPQLSQAPDDYSKNLHPQDTQRLDNSTNLSPTAQQQTQSRPPDSPTSPLHSSHPSLRKNIMVLRFTDGSEHHIDLVEMLLGAKDDAKTNGFKRFGHFGDNPCETLMQNPCLLQLKTIDLDSMSIKSNDDEEEEEDDQEYRLEKVLLLSRKLSRSRDLQHRCFAALVAVLVAHEWISIPAARVHKPIGLKSTCK